MESEESRLERLKRALYSRDASALPKEKRTPVSETEYDVKNSWGAPPSFDLPNDMRSQKNNSFFNKFLVGSIIFFLLALGAAAFIFLGGLNTISSNNVNITIAGPSSVSSGEELDLDLSIINQNRTALNNASLSIEYPDGAQSVNKSGAVLSRDKVDLGTLSEGQTKDVPIRAILFGEKDAVKTITLTLNYSVSGSNAVFSKQKTFDVSISSSPLLLNVAYPTEINSGQDVNLSIDLTSNSSAVVSNTLIKVLYPYGFTYKSSSAKPLQSDSNSGVWNVGDMKTGDKKTLTIDGTLVGQDMEVRSFQVSVGAGSDPSSSDFVTSLAMEQATVGISKSFFNLAVTAPNNQGGFAQSGQNVQFNIDWQNTLPDKVINGNVVATLSGNIFDSAGVITNGAGNYRSTDDTITWDKNLVGSLSAMAPGDQGQLSFSLSPLSNPAQIRSVKNPFINVHVDMSGDRAGSDTSTVTSSQDLTVKFLSDLELSAKSYRSTGPFANTGPIPPRADQESTYTVTWTLTNSVNDLSSTSVSAILPLNVSWKGKTSPNGEHIAFDSDSRTVTWSVGNIAAGSGFTYSPKTVSFQVGVTPNDTQVGNALNLLSVSSAEATDTFAGAGLNASAQVVTTRFSDPGFQQGSDMVVK